MSTKKVPAFPRILITVLFILASLVYLVALAGHTAVIANFAAAHGLGWVVGFLQTRFFPFELGAALAMVVATIIAGSLRIARGYPSGLTLGTLVYTLYKGRIRTKRLQSVSVCLVIGLALGILSSFLGIGGGPFNLVILFYFFSMDTKTAAQNSLYIILFSQVTSLVTTLLTRSVPPFSETIEAPPTLPARMAAETRKAPSARRFS